MAKRMSKGLVVLSSAAIASVYGIGYAVTRPAAVSMAAGVAPADGGSTPAAGATNATAPGARSVNGGGSATSTNAGVGGSSTAGSGAASNSGTPGNPGSSGSGVPAGAAATASAGLKDGAYTGTGWSRHGSVSVSVTVQGGKIVSAPITGVTTRYSQSVIAGLPAKVVAGQTANVQLVSGATDSTTAYRSAVAQALGQAGGSTAPADNSVQVTGPSGVIYQNSGSPNSGSAGQTPTRNRGGRNGSFGY